MSSDEQEEKIDLRLTYDECVRMSVRDIRQTEEYKRLTPLGKYNTSGTYHYGNKSRMRKHDLCTALDNPKKYHEYIQTLKVDKRNAATRKRSTRKGLCLTKKRQVPCDGGDFPHKGLTSTGQECCFKKKQSKKTMDKRRKATSAKSSPKSKKSSPKSKSKPSGKGLTVKDLKQKAKSKGLTGYSTLNKSALLKLMGYAKPSPKASPKSKRSKKK